MLAQLAGTVVAILAAALWSLHAGTAMTTMHWLLVQAVASAVFAALAGLAWWWVLLNLVFAPALGAGVEGALAPGWSAAALVALLLVYGGTQATRVPLYLSSAAAVQTLRDLLPADRALSFLDLGAGTGTVLAAIAASHPNARVCGVERAPLPCLIAALRARLQAIAYHVRWANFWTTDLAPHDVVYAYLSPQPMNRLWEKAQREMRPGSLLVSFRFAIPGVMPTTIVAAGGNWMYVWRLP